MKRHLPFVAIMAFVCFISGCTSRQEKAEILIKDYFFQTLVDFDSYEPISTVFDTTYTTPYSDSSLLAITNSIHKKVLLANSYDENRKKIAKELSKWWCNDASSKVKQIEKYEEEIAKLSESADSLAIVFSEQLSSFSSKRSGWAAYHRFRCKDLEGKPKIGNYLFTFDPKVSSIISMIDLENENVFQNIALTTNLMLLGEHPDTLKAKEYFRRFFLTLPEASFEDFLGE